MVSLLENHFFYFVFVEVISKFRDRINKLEEDVELILKQEKEEKMMKMSEMQVNKAQNMLERSKESEHTGRSWFQTKAERMQEKGILASLSYLHCFERCDNMS